MLHAEVRALKLARPERQVGGVRFEGSLPDAWRANLWLRTAIRVLLRIERFSAPDGDALFEGASRFDWSSVLAPEGTLLVDAQSRESLLDHSQFAAQRVKDAIVDQMRTKHGTRPSVDKEDPDLRVHLHLFRDRATLSLDTSGDSLHKRGWRHYQGRAPLAETLAAGIVLLSEWNQRAPLLDPFCGSGTILIEAALLAENVAPGLFRDRFGFERWRGHETQAFAKFKERAGGERRPRPKLRLYGWDLEPERIEGARENAASAGVDERIVFERGDARQLSWRPGWNAWIVTNPPYGRRVGGDAKLEELYRRLGESWRREAGGYRLGLLSGDPRLTDSLGLAESTRVALKNGGLDCELALAAI